jgi:deoxycytidine triphosphate deaminase
VYLGKEKILERIREEGLLEGHREENVQGAGVDLRIGALFRPRSGAALRREDRRLPELEEDPEGDFRLAPGEYVLCVTMERVRMPPDLVAFLLPRSTLFRSGVSLKTAVVDPGYEGALTVGMKNEGAYDFALEKGARIAQIVFSRVEGRTANYSGRYQGGKVR